MSSIVKVVNEDVEISEDVGASTFAATMSQGRRVAYVTYEIPPEKAQLQFDRDIGFGSVLFIDSLRVSVASPDTPVLEIQMPDGQVLRHLDLGATADFAEMSGASLRLLPGQVLAKVSGDIDVVIVRGRIE